MCFLFVYHVSALHVGPPQWNCGSLERTAPARLQFRFPFARYFPRARPGLAPVAFRIQKRLPFGESNPARITLHIKLVTKSFVRRATPCARGAQHAEAHWYASRRRRACCQVVLRRDGVRLSIVQAAPHSLQQQQQARAA